MLTADGAPSWRSGAIAAVLGLGTLLGVASIAYLVGHQHGEIGPSEWRPLLPALSPSPPESLPLLSDVARGALSRVVTVEVIREGAQAFGTAWLVDDRGDFVTNAHVLEGELAIRLRDRTGHTHVARVVGADRDQDLAVVRSEDGFSGAGLEMARRSVTPPADVVTIAAGRATGHDDVITDRVTRAHLDVPVRGNSDIDPGIRATTVLYHDMLGLDGARIYSGNSGGPVLNRSGEVVGIVTLASRSAPQAFAIPISRVIDELLSLAGRST